MQDNQYGEKHIEKSFDLKLFKELMHYAKPHWAALLLCFLMLLVVTVVEVSNPYIIKIAIDDIINPKERVYGIYQDYQDITTFDYQGVTYSSLAKRYRAPDETIRLIKEDGHYYKLNTDLDLSGGYTLINSNGQHYIQTPNSYYRAEQLDEQFTQVIDHENRRSLTILALFTLGLLILGFVFNYGQILILNLTSQKIVFKMREDLFAHIMKLDLHYFENNPVGRLVTRVTNDLDNINEMYTSVLLTIIKDVIMVTSIVAIMLYIDVALTIACLITFPLVILATVVFRNKIRAVQRKIKIQIAIINAKLSEYISGMNIIQIFGVEDKFYNDFKASNDEYKTSTLEEIRIYGVFRPTMSFIYSMGLITLLLYGTSQVMAYVVELGVLVAFTRYIKQFYQPIFDFSEKFNIMQSAMASAERLSVIRATANSVANPLEPKLVKKLKGDICFKHVWFAYKDEDYVLKDVSFDIKAGETVAFVGHTGSGKTTITNLISRFYDIQKGEITIDGIDIKALDKDKLRAHIGMVLQDVYLFSASVNENIRMYNQDISSKRLIEAAKVVNAKPFIDRLPGGFNYVLKERGNEFSTGQRQLLSFARALAYNPEIMILDEATSNIDTETELLIQDAIAKLSQKRTSIVIAHRLSTIINADKIIVLNKGEICEIGNHEQLLANRGLYYDLYQLQYE